MDPFTLAVLVFRWVVSKWHWLRWVLLVVAVMLVMLLIEQHFKNYAKLKTDNTNLKTQIETKQATIDRMTQDVATLRGAIKGQEDLKTAQDKSLRDQTQIFNKNGRSFSRLAYEKPSMLQKRINDATQKQFQCIESVAGTPTTPCSN